MKIKKTVSRDPAPVGVYPARCYKIMHIGTVPNNYDGTMRNTIRIDWELPTLMKVFDMDKGEQPLSISKDYTASFNEKSNLYNDLSSWLGDLSGVNEFEIEQILGRECYINIQHKTSKSSGNTYAFIAAIMPLPPGSVCPPPINHQFIWDYVSIHAPQRGATDKRNRIYPHRMFQS
ncbi:MAG: hypothetical protein P1P82_18240, partial [Bacteroidales bacterium]|nr:hypothetical protein [Bacteroidales bacterium]